MRRFRAPRRVLAALTSLAVALLALGLALPAAAQDDDWDDWGESEEDEESGFSKYLSAVGNRYAMGANSLATFPADPILDTIQPLEQFDKLPGSVVTRYPVGFGQGTLLSLYRASMGTVDLLFAPVTPFRMVSPAPRFIIFPGAEHEWY